MQPETEEWIAKAEGDFRSMEREKQVLDNPNYDLVCFLAQQCVEKYLKAVLVDSGIPFPKIHDLVRIAKLLTPGFEVPAEYFPILPDLNSGAVEFRYTGESATPEEANQFASACRALRSFFRPRLGLI